ncbi:trifunctional transcriptional regulator/proline dehydrogenase/L-glutamate gamma-semialdehyde dehydrogenase [Pseudomonas sp. OIL-1]|uniref:trifunctional transcriptional regulator/proline dehydrogenase/L-glutamate gamma-semialdehyde dehydrogenase n=1 Tax=Pseudomonas sp. OIL-1 TaxID=2706126 RepID=UPI0013A756D2|nr:trifunctional transcriptional regulator/proline dehydrogenase/L-glutamate gamma-semialdehyde dehydrogenase [Pseudomonas sp. OIL-1]QIB50876.1 trifunctional transcriptional regulator/proline dehydrogenase/L-glutamate gamma-semialdehyde dehydrogenase [Pseudomonas sp. OIL-1]
MANTTLGVKLDEATRTRLKDAAARIDRTPHWLIKQAIFSYLETLERGVEMPELAALAQRIGAGDTSAIDQLSEHSFQPFLEFAQSILPQPVLRAAITAAYRRPEPEIVPLLLEQARVPEQLAKSSHELAYRLAEQLRARKGASGRAGLVQGLLQEFSLSSQEGVALMCLAEALLRIPDKGTRDALIRDKISNGNWQQHLGNSPSMFVNAASWGLLVTGRLVSTHNEAGMTRSLNRIIGKSGEPVIRKAVDMAMRMMGEQFVTGETIGEALANASRLETQGFRYSYDMLGEAAMTDEDARAYMTSYEQAIHAIGKASNGRGIYEGPGISIKLSALHPRYSRAQYDLVIDELYPRLLELVRLGRHYDIGINIDAEEADRLELSLDLLERLCFDPDLRGWNGIGFVIQAYQKRCPYVIDFLIDLARRSAHRLMIRLVKGAYWDSEIKFAQLEGLEGYPVFTRKMYTDISYIACARKLLAAPDAVYPQFATHNAHSLATIYHLAGQNYYPGQYEFQCLHGMGEPLYDQVVGKTAEGKLNRPCRIYAPVGTHETLLAYLVRRLLENGANTSFVNRIADRSVSISELVEDPIVTVQQSAVSEGTLGLPHPRIPLPRDLYGKGRANSSGIDLSNEQRLASLSSALLASTQQQWRAQPMLGCPVAEGKWEDVRNPADLRDCVGQVRNATEQEARDALQAAEIAAPIWQATPPTERAAILERAADVMESHIEPLLGLLAREAGKTFSNGIAEVREAVDFLRFYARQAREDFNNDTHRPLGTVLCISPWNFPLAIFTGQVVAALAAGNTVIAKPAEQTSLVAAQAIQFLLQAGVPEGAVQLLPGDGAALGNVLVSDERIKGVMFTGSTEVASVISQNLAGRLDAQGRPIPLIAETGGQNAMIVDSSALTEQVVADVVDSAFDSAGQRCSALRVLCVQDDVAERLLRMLEGTFAGYSVGDPGNLATDVGPVIDAEARITIERHINEMREKGRRVVQAGRHEPDALSRGTFVLPTLIEIENLDELQREVFGPVLHVLRYRREDLSNLLDQINHTGYGLTLGVHTRIDETIEQVVNKARVGNLYVNRNIVGAVVGVQPFGGEGLSGTGPKAGGPLYMYRLLSSCPAQGAAPTFERMGSEGETEARMRERLAARIDLPAQALRAWASEQNNSELVDACDAFASLSQSGLTRVLPGPTGERNTYTILPRERVLCLADDQQDRLIQLAALLAVGCTSIWPEDQTSRDLLACLPAPVQARIESTTNWEDDSVEFEAVLHHGDSDQLRELCKLLAQRSGPIIGVSGYAPGDRQIALERLYIERSLSINTAAAGGNASLMSIS